MPECLPAGGTHRRRGLLERAAHRIEDRFVDAECQWEGYENIGQDYGVGRKHYMYALGIQEPSKGPVRPPKEQKGKTGDGRRNGGRQRDRNDYRVAAPKTVF